MTSPAASQKNPATAGIDLPDGYTLTGWVWPRAGRWCRCGGRLGPLGGELSAGVRARRCGECGLLSPAPALAAIAANEYGDEVVIPLE